MVDLVPYLRVLLIDLFHDAQLIFVCYEYFLNTGLKFVIFSFLVFYLLSLGTGKLYKHKNGNSLVFFFALLLSWRNLSV